ncbi:Hpt domain-containing protein [Hoeflea halophila]|uniref:Hpt domain-containing protein n=1 Tax=Hoeflea halophila TaxID=714899 RepID=A0A286IBU8_9HYPH|nr:Hpt domain-containing protein [Hoeflea halophila]SOE17126.1 Hpt domain-containing protein [Hoeflea halophila]
MEQIKTINVICEQAADGSGLSLDGRSLCIANVCQPTVYIAAQHEEVMLMLNRKLKTTRLDQLPPEARDRIEQLRHQFIQRSRGHLDQIGELLAARQSPGGMIAADAGLSTLAHSLVGASGVFGFQALGEAAVRLEKILRQDGYCESGFTTAITGLINEIEALD